MKRREISVVTLKKMGKLLAFIGENEQRCEFARQNLCKLRSFEPYSAFQRIDRTGKGFITARDISSFMR